MALGGVYLPRQDYDYGANARRIYGLGAPVLATEPMRLTDVAVGAGYLQSSALNGTISAVAAIPWADISGAPTFLADPGGNGIVVRTSSGTTAARTLGTDASITISNPSGVAGAPTFSRAALTGAVIASAGSNATTFGTLAATSVLANATGSTAVPSALASSGNGQVLQQAAGALTFAALAYSSLSGAPTIYYQTVAQAGSGLTQRATLNFGGGLLAVDNSGATRTDVTTTLTAGYVGFGSASNTLTGSSALFYDEANVRLSIGLPAGQTADQQLNVIDQGTMTGVFTGLRLGQYSSTASHQQGVRFRRADGTRASPTAVGSSFSNGTITWDAYDGGSYRTTNAITVQTVLTAAGRVSAAVGVNDVPTVITFGNGSQFFTELRLAAGNEMLRLVAGSSPRILSLRTQNLEFNSDTTTTAHNATVSGASSSFRTIFALNLQSLWELSANALTVGATDLLDAYWFRGPTTRMLLAAQNTNVKGINHVAFDAPTFESTSVNTWVSSATVAIYGPPSAPGGVPTYGLDIQGADTTTSLRARGGVIINGAAAAALQVTTFGAGYVKSSAAGIFSVSATVTAADVTGLFYQTMRAAGTGLTQRASLSADGTVVMTDDAGNSRTNIGLPTVGPGVGLVGGAGISSVTLDAYGRVTALVTATYLADPGANGMTARTSSGATAARTLTPGDATIVISNGNGVSGNPTITGGYIQGAGITITGNIIAATGGGGSLSAVTASLPLASSGGTAPNITLNYDSSLALSGSNLQRAALTGAIVATAGSNATTFGTIAALSVLANSSGSTGVPSALSSTTSGHVLQQAAGALVFAALPYSVLSGAPTLYYQSVYTFGSAVTQRSILNFGSEFLVADNAGATRTDVSIASYPLVSRATAAPANAVNLGAMASGLLSHAVIGSVSTLAALNGTTGSVVFFSSTGVPGQDNASFYYDAANARFGVGTNSLTNTTTGFGASAQRGKLWVRDTTSGGYTSIVVQGGSATSGGAAIQYTDTSNTPTADFGMGNGAGTTGTLYFVNRRSTGDILFIIGSTTYVAATTTGVTLSSLSSGGMVKSTAGLLGIASASDVASAITWPATSRVLVSSGTSTAPTGAANLTFASNLLKIGDGTTLATPIAISTAADSGVMQFWKDVTPTRAASVGIGVPGVAPGNDLVFGTYNAGWSERGRFVSGGTLQVVSLAAGGMTKAAVGGGLAIALVGTDYQAAITWPATNRLLVSTGTGTSPIGDATLTFASGVLRIGDGTTATYPVGIATGSVSATYQFWRDATPTTAVAIGNGLPGGSRTDDMVFSSYGGASWVERMRVTNDGSLKISSPNATIETEIGGSHLYFTGSGANNFTLTDWGQVSIGSTAGNTGVIFDSTKALHTSSPTLASASGLSLDAITLNAGVTLTGTTTIATATGLNGIRIARPTYSGSGSAVNIDLAATMYIQDAPLAVNGATIDNKYALWIDSGEFRLDGVSTPTGSNTPLFATTPGSPTQAGWIPIVSDGVPLMVPAWYRT